MSRNENIVSQYSYLTNHASGTIVFTFSTEQKNCENFKDEEKFFCQTELEKIDLNKIITNIFESIKK